MSDTHESPICPGQRTLFGESTHPHYLRVAVTVFYNDTSPNGGKDNTDFFYLHNYPLHPFGLAVIAKLEDDILKLLQRCQGEESVNRVAYISYQGIPMSEDDVKAVGWRFMDGRDYGYAPPVPVDPEPAPVPVPPIPAPASASAVSSKGGVK